MSRRLTLVIHSLRGGGAEKSMALLANAWSERGCQVTLITLDAEANDVHHTAPNVRRVGLDAMGVSPNKLSALANNFRRWRRLRKAIQQTDAEWVVSFTDKTNVLTLLACWGLKQRVAVCERTDPRRHAIGRVWSWLRRRLYPTSSAVVVQTGAVKSFVQQLAGRRPVVVIPNCVWPAVVPQIMPKWEERAPVVIGLGRLSQEKGFDALIEAFAQVAAKHPSWKLKIIGEGEQRPQLESLLQKRALQTRVELCGWLENPVAELCRAQIFVLPSKYEGFPNALLEAMACGLAPISFDCPSGPSEIIRHNIDGLLTPPEDIAALAAALEKLITDDNLRRKFAERAVEVVARFSPDAFFALWEQVFNALPPTTSKD